MTYVRAILIGCVMAVACDDDDKALSSPGRTATGVTTVGAAGAPPTNPLPPIIDIAGQVVQPERGGSGIGGTEVVRTPSSGAAGSGAIGVPTGAAGSGF